MDEAVLLRELRTWFNRPVLDALHRMRELIVTSADDLVSRFNTATNTVAGELTKLKTDLAAAIAALGTGATQEQIDAAVQEQLAKFDAPIATLEQLGADNADPIPAPSA